MVSQGLSSLELIYLNDHYAAVTAIRPVRMGCHFELFLKILYSTILYLSILLHFCNTIHIKSSHKTFSVCRATLYHSAFAVYTTCFGLYRPSSGVSLIVAKTVTRVA
jgi:hypothetical protein